MEKLRCNWCGNDELYQRYHDEEWGKLVKDDKILFEFILLESFQAGLSWITILRKRENFRQAFDEFDYLKIAKYQEDKVEELKKNEGIVRNRLKINAAINNAKQFQKVQQEFGSFYQYLQSFFPEGRLVNHWEKQSDIPASTPLSDRISKDLKKRGFKFVGTTIIYSFLQATGFIDDHIEACFAKSKVSKV
ncbi:DNA-3-methyladenine glycosylase I [Elizabethkingia sp. JS20170427COW]|uniref:DNA-3-methyladenine glycosylase I n=1 Tax=Elizabethkingia sp. JS20170427COW TaxID=2583851 RepID=UPI0011104EBA|nr:DNA-3-methyladenine glycosylase I [Elizabethkingia sp. JS20170427COW]QCX52411.1 DNA-3-methyladenine glycosylase I [Elizabethkingia sp. JS20170427COW]